MNESAEFDKLAGNYKELLSDPIRERFTGRLEFFAERKWDLLCDFYRRNKRDPGRERWLDIGCGMGELLRLGAPSFAGVAGCDPSAEMIKACADIPVALQTSPQSIPFPDASFNLVTAVCVYHHVEPEFRLQLTSEALRVLRPGGTFCIMEHNPLNPATQIIVKRSPIDVNARLLTSGTARRLLRSAGFGALQTTYFLYLPEGMYRRMGGAEKYLSRVPFGGQYAVFGAKPR